MVSRSSKFIRSIIVEKKKTKKKYEFTFDTHLGPLLIFFAIILLVRLPTLIQLENRFSLD